MFELGLGVLLAAVFIAVYLLIAKLFRSDRRELGGLPPSVSLNPVESANAIGAGKTRAALSAGELSEHHAGGEKKAGAEPKDSEKQN